MMVSHRSTKGASKARRDHINNEIRNMRALLPISQEDRERLSYLHSMAAICTYIRKSILFQGLPAGEEIGFSLPREAFLEALHGFILVTTTEGRLVYVSENVSKYLGHSMVDILQGDTIYDMVLQSDIDLLKSQLDISNNLFSERRFVCCLQASKAYRLQHGSCCSVLMRGSFMCSIPNGADSEPLFVALCTPTANRLRGSDSHLHRSFSSAHTLDMTFSQTESSVLYFLGFSAEEMCGRSWYSLIHPEDLGMSADSHKSLMQAGEGFQVEMVLRLQCQDLSWAWTYTRAERDFGHNSISCTNYIITETEARFLQGKVTSDAFEPNSSLFMAPPVALPQTSCFATQRASSNQSEEPCSSSRRDSDEDVHSMVWACEGSPAPLGDSPALFTPPYSSTSSESPRQGDCFGVDFLMDVGQCADQLSSSPEASPPYYDYPEARLTHHLSPTGSLHSAAAEQTFGQGAFGTLSAHSPTPSLSPTSDFPPATSNARLVPDCPSLSDMCESPVDCDLHQDDLTLFEQPQGGSTPAHLVPLHALPTHLNLPTPNPSPTSHRSFEYTEREQAEISILAQQISSLASSFDLCRTMRWHQSSPAGGLFSSRDWSQQPPPKDDVVLDSHFESIFKDLDVYQGKDNISGPCLVSYNNRADLACDRVVTHQLHQELSGVLQPVSEDFLPTQQFTAEDVAVGPSALQMGSQDQSTGLHQLSHYMQHCLQRDGFAEENLY